MNAAPIFPGIGLGGYRSFPIKPELLAPLERINVLIGPNNVGKSTALGFFSQHIAPAFAAARGASRLDESFLRDVEGEPPAPFTILWPLRDDDPGDPDLSLILDEGLADESGVRWLSLASNEPLVKDLSIDPPLVEHVEPLLTAHAWNELSGRLTTVSGGRPGDNVRRVLQSIREDWMLPPPQQVLSQPPHRQITSHAGSATDWQPGRAGLIEFLNRLRNPEPRERLLRDQHQRILDAVSGVLELSDFGYHVSHESNTLILEIDGQRRALAEVGTGYEHIVLLVAATVAFPRAILCVEEPEVHMHPRLQRRLAEYLSNETSNQLLVSTHSATLIDALDGTIFRLRMEDDATHISRPVASETLHLLDDLGYRASDLLQTNSAIWVEGPSDRIYIKWWLNSIAPELVEGVHYCVMFYGGSLLAGVSAAEESDVAEDMVPLRRLNQHFVVLADSDKTNADAPLKKRVERLQVETAEHAHGFVWVTAGRTIENYAPIDAIAEAIKSVHPSTSKVTTPGNEWSSALDATTADGTGIAVDKVRVAQAVANGPANLSVLDLEERMNQLIDFIRGATP